MKITKEEYENILTSISDCSHLEHDVVSSIINHLWDNGTFPTDAVDVFRSVEEFSLKNYYAEYGNAGDFTNMVTELFGEDRAGKVKNFSQLTSAEKKKFMEEFIDDLSNKTAVFDYNTDTGDIVILRY